jgi:t-SNARE complex subunit (syntaxin)
LEIKQLYSFMCSIGTKLHEAVKGRNADEIKSHSRALNSEVVGIQEAATREAEARGWDLNVVESMMQEVDDSACELLQEADRVLRELAEQARTS